MSVGESECGSASVRECECERVCGGESVSVGVCERVCERVCVGEN